MIVDKDYLDEILAYIDLVNDTPLEDIIWKDKEGLHKIDPKLREQWKFTGLSNIWFYKDELRTKRTRN